MKYLIDTDVCVNIIRSKEGSMLRRVCAGELDLMSISSITVAELEHGAAKSSRPEQNSLALMQFLTPIHICNFDAKAARCYGGIRAELEKMGKRIGPMDMLIAAQALADKLILITNNYREFGRIKGLSTESWHEIQL